MVKSYLIHNGYIETLQAIEEDVTMQDEVSLQVNETSGYEETKDVMNGERKLT